jgi:hypothetical protein
MTVCVCVLHCCPLRDSWPYEFITERLLVPLSSKMQTYRHSNGLHLNVTFK